MDPLAKCINSASGLSEHPDGVNNDDTESGSEPLISCLQDRLLIIMLSLAIHT